MPETQSYVNWFNREAVGSLPVLRCGAAFAPGGNRSNGALLPHSISDQRSAISDQRSAISDQMPVMSSLVNVLQRNEYLNGCALSGFTIDLNEPAGFFRQILHGT